MSAPLPRILIFGSGSSGRRAFDQLSGVATVVGFLDNNPKMHGQRVLGVSVLSPQSLKKIDYDRICVASMYHPEIRQQLTEQLGVDPARIELAREFVQPARAPVPIAKPQSKKEALSRWLRQRALPSDRNDFRLWRLKNRFRGRRAFVLGNGPSLKLELLPRLQHETTFGMNQIFKCFDQTPWRPTFYAISDTLVAKNHGAAILRSYGGPVFASEHLRPSLGDEARITYFRKTHENYEDGEPPFSPNALWCLEGGYTTAYLCFQLGWFMGIRDFLTIGIDASYKFEGTQHHSRSGVWERVSNTPSENYFLPNYFEKDTVLLKPRVKQQVLAYRAARRFIESGGGRVRNAGADSPLDVFPKVQFEDLFAN